ncbi:MAG: bifunctional diaminohydroxyphosphoribosylaminopyrimidine deaminase/5-amino-6-(5-phosphoribosylamino)uracil reductase RibD [Alphaproteobacteria bacterium]|nr:bifunctional diaminohydroxyphosphoribosylaminopyrimidine deaminase/5-amino-6-(5-phosphoribosylamino)uracil reductase RibD [Alphaproteobacteria bacterium]
MSAAIALARGQLGRTSPNPAVGCVLVKDSQVIATGQTADGGRPHAERMALNQAGPSARGATAYVTLEPCAHHGKTPPCAEALVEAGVSHVVTACQDLDPRVAGKGITILRDADIIVESNIMTEMAAPLYEGFFNRIRTGRPLLYVSLSRLGFDGELPPIEEAGLDAFLDDSGGSGAARIRVSPDHALATWLLAEGHAKPL